MLWAWGNGWTLSWVDTPMLDIVRDTISLDFIGFQENLNPALQSWLLYTHLEPHRYPASLIPISNNWLKHRPTMTYQPCLQYTQKVDLTSLCYTLMHMPKVHWILIEDSDQRTDLIGDKPPQKMWCGQQSFGIFDVWCSILTLARISTAKFAVSELD